MNEAAKPQLHADPKKKRIIRISWPAILVPSIPTMQVCSCSSLFTNASHSTLPNHPSIRPSPFPKHPAIQTHRTLPLVLHFHADLKERASFIHTHTYIPPSSSHSSYPHTHPPQRNQETDLQTPQSSSQSQSLVLYLEDRPGGLDTTLL